MTLSIKEQSNAPTIGFDVCQLLRVQYAQHWYIVGEMDWLTFYMLCRAFLRENNHAWCEVHKTLATQECDEFTKWSVIMEMIRFRVVEVEKGVMCAKEVIVKVKKEKKAA